MFQASTPLRPQRPAMPLWAVFAYFGVLASLALGMVVLDHYRSAAAGTRSDDGNTLTLTATIEDPWGLREPVVAKKIWRWAPEQKITPYDACEPATAFKKGTNEP